MAYSNKVIDHYENPRNVGSLPKDSTDVGTGLVGAPECGLRKTQIAVVLCHDRSAVPATWNSTFEGGNDASYRTHGLS